MTLPERTAADTIVSMGHKGTLDRPSGVGARGQPGVAPMRTLFLIAALFPSQGAGLSIQEIKVGDVGRLNPGNGRLEVEVILGAYKMLIQRVVRSDSFPRRILGRSLL